MTMPKDVRTLLEEKLCFDEEINSYRVQATMTMPKDVRTLLEEKLCFDE
jgi:hypothetical protein